MEQQRLKASELAGIEYLGADGITATCVSAIARLLQDWEVLRPAYLLSCGQQHAFIVTTHPSDTIAVKSGFTSGYGGEGPRGLSDAVALLESHEVDVEEHEVTNDFLNRLNQSCLLIDDIRALKSTDPIRPKRLDTYRLDHGRSYELANRNLSQKYPRSLPFRIVDPSIMDLAVQFDQNADSALTSAYRRLEDRVRERSGLTTESGSKLFTQAFLNSDSPLTWHVPDTAESKGRAQLFIAAYMAFRNARAHREGTYTWEEASREFLLINQLFSLERTAVTREQSSDRSPQ